MRDLVLIAFIGCGLVATLRYPFAGLLLWAWFTLATPQQAAYAADQLPLNMIIAAVTFAAFALHGEFKRFRLTPLTAILLLFAAWVGVSQAFSLWPENSAEPADRLVKVMVFVLLCAVAATTRLRFHALLWTFALVMAFYGVKGGLYTIVKLGGGIYEGVDDTILYDNNHMGIALASTIPVFVYLAQRSQLWAARWGAWAAAGLSVVAIIGTNSRGALIALVALAGWTWLRSRRKVAGAVAALAVVAAAVPFLPEDWTSRMETIAEADEDASFRGRLDAWEINWLLALENPVTGVGIRNSYEPGISENVSGLTPRAAHSIYFEILGGMGFVGLALFLSLLGYGFVTAARAERRYAELEGGRWRAAFGRQAQASLVTFGVGGASVSMEMWEGYLLLIALTGALARIDLDPMTARKGVEVQRVRERAAASGRKRRAPKIGKIGEIAARARKAEMVSDRGRGLRPTAPALDCPCAPPASNLSVGPGSTRAPSPGFAVSRYGDAWRSVRRRHRP
jgi:probable O-glycosylation ligase (exosortase A-associated)